MSARLLNLEPLTSPLIQLNLVDVTPLPILAGFYGTDNWMLGRVEMLGGMCILRRIAATYVSAEQAHAQMHPGIAHFQAFLATLRLGMDLVN
jgi:hypothetical protein